MVVKKLELSRTNCNSQEQIRTLKNKLELSWYQQLLFSLPYSAQVALIDFTVHNICIYPQCWSEVCFI